MFKFKFGLLWTAIITPIFLMCLFVPGEQRNGADMDLFLFIFFVVFEVIGIYLIASGVKQILKERKKKRNGIHCYGIIYDLLETGSYSNGRPEFKAVVCFVNPETYQLEYLEEIVGFDYNKYPIYSYVLCKYYQGDINIETSISDSEIPGDEMKLLAPIKENANNMKEPDYNNVELSSDGEYVTIDGVQYKKDS